MVKKSIHDLSFRYNSHPVFSDASFDIPRGKVVSIIGRNGSGKSTLLKCINHILKPSQGHVLVADKDIVVMSRIERAKLFGFLSQKSESLFPTTVFDTVLNGRFPHSPVRFTRYDEEVVAEILADMELSEFSQRIFDHLSGGEQQQVLIARALAQDAEVMLLDEPTNNLDLKHQLQIMRLVRNVAQEKQITSIIAIHDLNLAATYSDTIIMLHNGGIYAYGCPSEILTGANILECFGVHTKIYNHEGIPHVVIVDCPLSHEPAG